MCAQVRLTERRPVPATSDPSDTPLGVPAYEAQIALQQDVVKELVNKVAWVLGSTYRASYSSMRMPARAYAWRIVKKIIEDHGYPTKIAIK